MFWQERLDFAPVYQLTKVVVIVKVFDSGKIAVNCSIRQPYTPFIISAMSDEIYNIFLDNFRVLSYQRIIISL